MMRRWSYCLAIMALMSSGAFAQEARNEPNESQVYCSGIVTSDPVPGDTYVISGQNSYFRATFSDHKLVFINKGSSQGVKIGDEFQVVRPVAGDYLGFEWFTSQNKLLKGMGTTYEDEARLRVVNVQPNISTAEIVFSCNYVERGDIVLPFSARPAPALKPAANFDIFAPASGKPKATVVTTKNFGELGAQGKVVYVNLGSAQGVNVGDYFRIFRYEGNNTESEFQTPHIAYQVFGFGSAPRPYTSAELPREILGEGVVLRVSKNAATVLVTLSKEQIYPGDYVELE
jgi:hypothetical protein